MRTLGALFSTEERSQRVRASIGNVCSFKHVAEVRAHTTIYRHPARHAVEQAIGAKLSREDIEMP